MPYYDDQIADDARFTLAQAVDDAVSDYVAAFRDHWGFDAKVPPLHLSQDDWLAMKRIDGEADKVVTVAATLVRRKGAGPKLQADADFMAAEAAKQQKAMDELQHQMEQHFPHLNAWQLFIAMAPSDASDPRTTHSVFKTLVQIGALKQFYADLDLAASRVCSLLGYLVRYPNQRSAKYLGRVARCYVLDMLPELAVMARSALDVALEEIVPDDKVRDRLGIPARDRVGLSARLEYFKEMDLLKEPQTKNADLIKAAGDAAAHGKEWAFDADQLLTALSAVLTAIDPFQPGSRVPA